jgi:predicted Zn-ribbon and HTH transcriptional regulator
MLASDKLKSTHKAEDAQILLNSLTDENEELATVVYNQIKEKGTHTRTALITLIQSINKTTSTGLVIYKMVRKGYISPQPDFEQSHTYVVNKDPQPIYNYAFVENGNNSDNSSNDDNNETTENNENNEVLKTDITVVQGPLKEREDYGFYVKKCHVCGAELLAEELKIGACSKCLKRGMEKQRVIHNIQNKVEDMTEIGALALGAIINDELKASALPEKIKKKNILRTLLNLKIIERSESPNKFLILHGQNRTVRCHRCGYEWFFKGNGERAKCPICNTTIVIDKDQITYKAADSEKKFTCKLCGKDFNCLEDRALHYRMAHQGELKSHILTYLEGQGNVKIEKMLEDLGFSSSPIYRQLLDLEKEGKVEKVGWGVYRLKELVNIKEATDVKSEKIQTAMPRDPTLFIIETLKVRFDNVENQMQNMVKKIDSITQAQENNGNNNKKIKTFFEFDSRLDGELSRYTKQMILKKLILDYIENLRNELQLKLEIFEKDNSQFLNLNIEKKGSVKNGN